MLGDLCAGFFDADFGTKIDLQDESWVAGFRQGRGTEDAADAQLYFAEIVPADGGGAGRARRTGMGVGVGGMAHRADFMPPA